MINLYTLHYARCNDSGESLSRNIKALCRHFERGAPTFDIDTRWRERGLGGRDAAVLVCRVRLPEQAGRPACLPAFVPRKTNDRPKKWVPSAMRYARPYLRGFAMSSLPMREICFFRTLQQLPSITRRVIYTRSNVQATRHTVLMADVYRSRIVRLSAWPTSNDTKRRR